MKEAALNRKLKIGGLLHCWEFILICVFLLINGVVAAIRPDLYFSKGTVTSMIQSGMISAPLVLGMALVTLLGDVDVSCSANMICCGMVTGLCIDHGVNPAIAVALALVTGVVLGAFNGFVVAYVGLPAVIVTISTSLLYRGLVKIILEVNVLKHFPSFYAAMMWRDIGGVPISMLVFLALAVVFIFLLHKTKFGRTLYMIGSNPVTSEFSGIDVKRTKLIVFMIMGLMAGVASIFYVGRMGGGLNSTMGTGEEMNAIAVAALGGIAAGRGKMTGPVIGVFIFSTLTYALGLLGINDNGKSMFTGVILVLAVVLANRKKS